MRMIELGYYDFFGTGTNIPAALEALDAAVRIDKEGRTGERAVLTTRAPAPGRFRPVHLRGGGD
jgi:hypothetical protein